MPNSNPDPTVGPEPVPLPPVGWALVVVAVGGALGAWGRSALLVAVPPSPGTWPWATFAANLIGAALIGVIAGALLPRSGRSLVRVFLMTGVLGGFTTFSAFAVETRGLMLAGRPDLGLIYIGASVVGCAVAAGLGRRGWTVIAR